MSLFVHIILNHETNAAVIVEGMTRNPANEGETCKIYPGAGLYKPRFVCKKEREKIVWRQS